MSRVHVVDLAEQAIVHVQRDEVVDASRLVSWVLGDHRRFDERTRFAFALSLAGFISVLVDRLPHLERPLELDDLSDELALVVRELIVDMIALEYATVPGADHHLDAGHCFATWSALDLDDQVDLVVELIAAGARIADAADDQRARWN